MFISMENKIECKNDTTKFHSPINCDTKNKKGRLPQYYAVLSVCVGSLAQGAALGWTGNISEDMKSLTYNGIEIDDTSLGWIGSLITLGMMVSCIPIGKLCDLIGRKMTMISVTIPFTIGWLLILYANSLTMLYVGRFLIGMASGAFNVAAPIYTTEIAQKEIRGALGNYLELFTTIGIMVAYITPMIMNMKMHTYFLGALPLIFAALFAFQPESPLYRMQQKREADAKTSLIRLRGDNYDVESELNDMKESENKISVTESLKKKGTQKAIIASFGLMFFQATTGIYALVLYTDTIFESSGSDIDAKTATLVLGAVQTITAIVSCNIADKITRRILLTYSSLFITISLLIMGIFTTLVERKLLNQSIISSLSYVPLISLSIYMVAYCIAIGPIPWVVNAELYPTEIRGPATGAAATFSAFISFFTAKLFLDIKNSVGGDVNYYIFSGFTFVGIAFIVFYLPETKGKTLEEIQNELNR